MSAETETAKSMLEIYTPVIVGLGAVILGLLANSLLEWWKSHLQDTGRRQRLRKLLYIETDNLMSSTAHVLSCLENEEDQQERFVLYRPRTLISKDISDFGYLSTAEVKAVSEVIGGVDYLSAFGTNLEGFDGSGGLIELEIKADKRHNMKAPLASIKSESKVLLDLLDKNI